MIFRDQRWPACRSLMVTWHYEILQYLNMHLASILEVLPNLMVQAVLMGRLASIQPSVLLYGHETVHC